MYGPRLVQLLLRTHIPYTYYTVQAYIKINLSHRYPSWGEKKSNPTVSRGQKQLESRSAILNDRKLSVFTGVHVNRDIA
jgi:hypothetical protein